MNGLRLFHSDGPLGCFLSLIKLLGPLHPCLVFGFFRYLPFLLPSSSGSGSALGGRAPGRAAPAASPRPPGAEAHCLSSREPPRWPLHWAHGAGTGAASSLAAPFPSSSAPSVWDGAGGAVAGLSPPFRYISSTLLLSVPAPSLQDGPREVSGGHLSLRYVTPG